MDEEAEDYDEEDAMWVGHDYCCSHLDEYRAKRDFGKTPEPPQLPDIKKGPRLTR